MNDVVLVTGGAGYVGSHTTMRLLESGRNVVILDNLSTGHVEVVRLYERLYGPKQFVFEQVDLLDRDAIASVFERHSIDGVIDFAAKSLVGDGQSFPRDYYDTNVIGFLNLVTTAGDLPIVKSSTAATYGNPLESDLPLPESYQDDVVDEGRFDQSQLMASAVAFEALIEWYTTDVEARSGYGLTERDIRKLMIPTNVYGITKMMDELILQKRAGETGAGFACLRYFNVAGADPSGLIGEDHDPETHSSRSSSRRRWDSERRSLSSGTITRRGTGRPFETTCLSWSSPTRTLRVSTRFARSPKRSPSTWERAAGIRSRKSSNRPNA